jgi:hypothetical protein
MSEIVSGGIVKALAVFLQAALAFHRHIGEGAREKSRPARQSAGSRDCDPWLQLLLNSEYRTMPGFFTPGTTHDVPTSTRIPGSGLFKLEFADRSSAHALQRSTE